MEYFSKDMDKLVQELSRLPGIGAKSAQRLAYHIINEEKESAYALSDSIKRARDSIRYCKCCCTLTDEELCPVCRDEGRNHRQIMVVENPRVGRYNGVYHVLHGAISPLLGIGPDDIRLKELMQRRPGDVEEIIIATNSSLEGETTASYIVKLIKPLGIKLSRIASGVPVGGDIENIDEITLLRALDGRVSL